MVRLIVKDWRLWRKYDALWKYRFFFIIISILLIPTILLGLSGKTAKRYNIFISIVILAIIFGHSVNGTVSLVLFTLFQLVLIISYQKYRLQKKQHYGICQSRSTCYFSTGTCEGTTNSRTTSFIWFSWRVLHYL